VTTGPLPIQGSLLVSFFPTPSGPLPDEAVGLEAKKRNRFTCGR